MNRDRLWVIGAALGIVVVVVMGWFLGVSPLVAQASTANNQATALVDANLATSAKLVTLKKQFDDIDTLQSDLAALRQSIPTGADIPTFLTEINQLCAKYHVSLSSVIVNDAVIYIAPAAPVAPVTAGAPAASTPTPTPSPSTAPAEGAPAAAPTTATGGLVYVPVLINVTGKFEDVMNFAGGVQSGARLYLANELQVAPGASVGGGRPTKFLGTMSGNIYTLAGTSGDLPATANPAPVVTPEPTPTDTATPDPTDTPIPTGTATPTP